MTGARSYSAPKTPDAALTECREKAGRQFATVEALMAVRAPRAVAA